MNVQLPSWQGCHVCFIVCTMAKISWLWMLWFCQPVVYVRELKVTCVNAPISLYKINELEITIHPVSVMRMFSFASFKWLKIGALVNAHFNHRNVSSAFWVASHLRWFDLLQVASIRQFWCLSRYNCLFPNQPPGVVLGLMYLLHIWTRFHGDSSLVQWDAVRLHAKRIGSIDKSQATDLWECNVENSYFAVQYKDSQLVQHLW